MQKVRGRKKDPAENPEEQAHARKPESPTPDNGPNRQRDGKDQTGVFFDRLRQAGEDYWDSHTVYLYRRFPRVARNGKPHYEATYRRAVDEEFLKATHGSGAYLLKLNDSKHTLDQTSLEIQDIAAPPRIDVRELVDCPENAKYHELWPKDAGDKSPSAASHGDAAVKELASLLKTVLTQKGADETDPVKETLVKWALDQTAEQRKENSPTALAGLLTALKGILPTQQGQSEKDKVDILDRVWALVERAQKRNDRSEEPKQKPISELKEYLEVFAQLKTTLAPEPPSAPIANPDAELWEKIALTVTGQVSSLANALPGIIAAWRFNGAVPPFPTTSPVAPQAQAASFDPYAHPDLLKQHARNLNGQVPGQAPAAAGSPAGQQPPIITPPPADTQLQMLLQTSGGLAVNALNNGVPGFELADAVTRLYGTAMHAAIANLGEDVLCQGMLAMPEFALFGDARLRRFAHEFVNFEQFLELEGDEAGDAGMESEAKRERVGV